MKRMKATLMLCGLVVMGGLCQGAEQDDEARARAEQRRRWRLSIHDPSTIVKCGGEYWLFATGRRIKSFRSKDFKTWTAGPAVLTTLPAWHKTAVPGNRGHLWAPDVIHHDGRYLLYYSVSTWGVRTSAIGLVSNVTLDPNAPDYRWVDQGLVIQSSDDVNFNAIDPGITLGPDGRLWMTFGSYWSGIKLIELDPKTGKRIAPDSPIHALAHSDAIEAPCIWHHDKFYYLFVNWGQCCRGVDSTYNIRVGRGATITGPYLDKAGIDLLDAGGSRFLETNGEFIGPGHAAIFSEGGTDWLGYHYYDGAQRGLASLGITALQWDNDGWPVAVAPPARLMLKDGQ
ncbi:MAG: arabinan endo-1,5-alpha-L-arabinosidase [Phycisphaerales bacterium]|nr:MAG: arabinan endo-1,5-alpha-L-arabinosidase [Phycisphaerales bacterium]